MFKKMRRRLTLFYTVVMATFFILLVLATHMSMEWSVTSEQEREVLLFAEEEAYEHAILFQHREVFEGKGDYKNRTGRMYFYALNTEGQIVNAARPAPEVEHVILEKIENWDVGIGEVTLLAHDGGSKLMMAAMPIVTARGDRLGTVYVGRDITAIYHGLKKSTMLLAVFSALALILATLVGYIMAGRAIVPLREAYEQQRQFAADASHELRTPLSVVMSSIDVLLSERKDTTPFIRQVIDDMKDEIRRMAKLVGDLLIIARGDHPNQQIAKESFNLTFVVDQVLRKMQPLAEQKRIALTFADRAAVEVNADLERVEQLILILVDNAVKYTPENGSVTVQLERDPEAGKVKIIVSDTGIGIPVSDQPHIFDRFYRVDKARSRQSGGSGLGLAIAKGIVNRHRGEIAVKSAVGSGAAFIVVLPK